MVQDDRKLLPEGIWLRTVRADSGFFDGNFLDFLEERGLPYGVVARLTTTLEHRSGRPSMNVTRRESSG